MDNSSAQVLRDKCNRFEQLYHGSINGQQYCLGTNVGKEYMCPLVSRGQIEEMPLDPWFAKQSQNAITVCHQKGPLLGKYHVCPNQSNYSHYQEDPFQRGKFINTGANVCPASTKTSQRGGYVFSVYPKESSDPYQNFPAQQSYFVKRCLGSRLLFDPKLNQPIPPAPRPAPRPAPQPAPQPASRSSAQQSALQSASRSMPNSKSTIPVDSSIPTGSSSPLGSAISAFPFGSSSPPTSDYGQCTSCGPSNSTIRSKPSIPPLGRNIQIKSDADTISGLALPMNYLEVDQPDELTNRFVFNQNITPGYYPDMIKKPIAKRPVYTARNLEADIPEIIIKNKGNMLNCDAGCSQPVWGSRCV